MAPSIVMTIVAFMPFFLQWLLGLRTSQAGDRGHAKGMRKTWSVKLALAVAFLKSYLRCAEAFTIEYCQGRSRAIPFMTAPLGISVKKIKIPAFPWRPKAEMIVLACLSDQEKEVLRHCGMDTTEKDRSRTHQEGDDYTQPNNHMSVDHECRYQGYQGDQYAEGLDAEWLEHSGLDEFGPETCTTDNARAVLYFHGGGYYTGSKEEHRVLIGPLVKRLGKNIRILIVNYRLAPQDPFPAALVDALSCYMWLLDQPISEAFSLDSTIPGNDSDRRFQPHQIVLMGDSAGGGLALSLSLLLRDHGALTQPRGIVTWSPWLDLTSSLPSFKANALTDIIPYEDYTHVYSEVVERMFEHHEDSTSEGDRDAPLSTEPRLYQRAQIYCPDSCLRIKYVSPLYETNYRGIPSVFVLCGSAERFADECLLLAARLEKQQQPCRIDIFEDMPHVFPLFRFHRSAMAAFDRTGAYIRELVQADLPGSYGSGQSRGQVIIPISSPSISSPALSSFSQTPSPSPPPFLPDSMTSPSTSLPDGRLICLKEETSNTAVEMANLSRPFDLARTTVTYSSPPSIRSDTSSTTLASTFSSSSLESSALGNDGSILEPEPRFPSKRIPSFGLQEDSAMDAWMTGVSMEESRLTPSATPTTATTTATATTVNVIDLSGNSVLSYHPPQTPASTGPCAPLLANQESQQRRRRRQKALRIHDIVSEATLYEWEILLTQGYIPTRRWQLPPRCS
ncbi:hypothetical protein EC968_005433 [Mortierella alpina]|nr:hypothetical protein EC968_005433 [Mortierella alpina]